MLRKKQLSNLLDSLFIHEQIILINDLTNLISSTNEIRFTIVKIENDKFEVLFSNTKIAKLMIVNKLKLINLIFNEELKFQHCFEVVN